MRDERGSYEGKIKKAGRAKRVQIGQNEEKKSPDVSKMAILDTSGTILGHFVRVLGGGEPRGV